ncbi:MAG: hypothetical protein U9O94_06300 [Nanoarchaeota archaeon]|nr:hypothetical protein [Nanoarchaeota archaeon]
MTQVTINHMARRAVYALLETHIICINTNTEKWIVKYKSTNHSDKYIAERVKEAFPTSDISASKVAGIRSRAWGTLEKPLPLEEQIKQLKEENGNLQRLIDQQNKRIEEAIYDN